MCDSDSIVTDGKFDDQGYDNYCVHFELGR